MAMVCRCGSFSRSLFSAVRSLPGTSSPSSFSPSTLVRSHLHQLLTPPLQYVVASSARFYSRRSVWKGPFVDAFLMKSKMEKKKDLANRKIWSRRSTILPEFVNSTVRIYNGKTHVRCKITEDKVGHKFGEFASTRKRKVSRPGNTKGAKTKGKK